MEKKNRRFGAVDGILLAVSVLFFIGIRTFFKSCGPAEDGSWMTCHWACQAISGVSAVILVIAVLHFIIPDPGIKAGLSIGILPAAVLAAVIPGHLIGLCMMNTMRCHAVMTPMTILFSVMTIAVSVVDIALNRKKA